MIRSFHDKETEKVFRREFSRRFQAVAAAAKRKLDHIHATVTPSDLGAIPGNRPEALGGDRKGQYSIRVNDQWRSASGGWVRRRSKSKSLTTISPSFAVREIGGR